MPAHSFFNLRFVLLLVFSVGFMRGATTDPHITSWVTARSYARVYETATDRTNGNAVTTWPRSGLTNGGGGQATVVYSDVQRVVYSTNYVYVYVTGLPSYTAGNWLTPNGMVYTSWPTNRGTIQKIPLNPTIPATKQANHGSGGVLVNGVFVWANGDAQSYSNASSTNSVASISMNGDGIWNRLAGVAETFNFDPAYGHQPSSGAYHNHINPIALRYQLGDNVSYNAATKVYSEAATPTKHSPLIGWANDGLPIYGPYGYSSAMDSTSGVRRMTSGFVKRDSTNAALYGTDDLAVTDRVKLPVWAASVQGKSQTLTSSQYGPTTTATYALGPVNKTCVVGTFAEDYEYLGDLGKTQGVDFDLNRQNVRYCVTPEFPNGTYAYFVCIDDNGGTVFPDIINQEYFGTAAMGPGTVSSINETVTEYKRGGQASSITLTAEASDTGVRLSWTSVEGGTYTVASSQDGSSYTTISSSAASAGTTTTYNTATLAPYYKVTLNALATYDTNGNGGVSGIGTSGSVSYPAGATPPAITTQPVGATVATGTKVTFTVAAIGTATLTYQWTKDGDPISGATSASYVIAKTKTTDSGTYAVTVTNGAGNVTSDDAVLVANDPPVITTQPASQTVTYDNDVTFSVTATSAEAMTYQWKKDGSVLMNETGSSLTIPAIEFSDAGSYTVIVTNSTSGGSTTSSAAVLAVAVPAPSISVAGEIPIGGAVALHMTGGNGIGGVTYYATGLPSGLSLDSATGLITGTITTKTKAGTYTVTYWAQYGSLKSAIQTEQMVVTTFPSGMVGKFEGLLEDGDDLPAGKVELTVTSTGTFTGKLTAADTKAYSLKGTLALNDDYTIGGSTLSISRGNALDAYVLTVSVSSGSVLSATLAGVGDTGTGVQLASYAKGETAPWAGTYTLSLGDPADMGTTASPEGDGYATATISSTGSLSVKGRLADGTTLTGTLAAGADGSYRWYLKPYKTAGSYLAGWLTLTERADETGRYEASSSDFYWLKAASSKDKLYPDGFGPIGLTVDLQKWVVPSDTASLGSLIGTGDGSLSLVIDGAGLSNADPGVNTYTLPAMLSLGSTATATVTDVTNPSGFSLKVNTANGSFTGSFTLTDGTLKRKVSLQGALLQLPSPASTTVVGHGYFLLSPTVKTDPTLSGALELVLP
ncbi:MAG TPA: YHYH protein [Rariglobus sp.]|nr:YHYH protein [Rariglobus sp.]